MPGKPTTDRFMELPLWCATAFLERSGPELSEPSSAAKLQHLWLLRPRGSARLGRTGKPWAKASSNGSNHRVSLGIMMRPLLAMMVWRICQLGERIPRPELGFG